jgi:hypothetical protein
MLWAANDSVSFTSGGDTTARSLMTDDELEGK